MVNTSDISWQGSTACSWAINYSARATLITAAFEAGIPGEEIQRTVGHASITTTEGYNQTARKLAKSASLGVQF